MIPKDGRQLGLLTVGLLGAYSCLFTGFSIAQTFNMKDDARYYLHNDDIYYKLPTKGSDRFKCLIIGEIIQMISLFVTMAYSLFGAGVHVKPANWVVYFQTFIHPVVIFVMVILYAIAVTTGGGHCYTEHVATEGRHGFHKPQSGVLQCDFDVGEADQNCDPTHPGAVVCLDATHAYDFVRPNGIDLFSSILSINPASATVLLFASIYFSLYHSFPSSVVYGTPVTQEEDLEKNHQN